MISATTRLSEKPLRLKYVSFSTMRTQQQPVKVRAGQYGNWFVAGEYVRKDEDCDGNPICQHKARYVITMVQFRECDDDSYYDGSTAIIRNYMLLCPSCLELYKRSDTMIGNEIDLETVKG